ncbi:aldo/keto reductase [Pseudoxanthomonas kalamensis DSM 18571]|uniref:aldo/keto reductase n=1 Tax=Pseudoxanthomonas kalamensis TaxID=289483 RepID=UPI0013907F4E|nr:aldo/keto reductase [Pseudoxanthomonas kalamensis]KAF1710422.1 aldo/keto reductase [Pseudoxanthomonas kalamensis DSM 18571]
MRTYRIPGIDLEVSRIALGCMTLSRVGNTGDPAEAEVAEARALIDAALAQGINLFDHADIYANGRSEQLFGAVLRQSPDLRDRIVLQSKCGIRFAGDPNPDSPGRYDFSRSHIVSSVEGSLHRLGTDHLDLLLLHRPDPLLEPAEVAAAFDQLQRDGKVLHFGVSNHTGTQISLLRKHLDQPLVVNQVELSLPHHALIDEGVVFNRQTNRGTANVAGTLDYCREHGILLQAWSPLAGGRLGRPATDTDASLLSAREEVQRQALAHGCTAEAILLAWLLRHPAGIQPIVGTTRPQRLADGCVADRIELGREDWYRLYIAARGAALP